MYANSIENITKGPMFWFVALRRERLENIILQFREIVRAELTCPELIVETNTE